MPFWQTKNARLPVFPYSSGHAYTHHALSANVGSGAGLPTPPRGASATPAPSFPGSQIPVDLGLCGRELCAQWIVACPRGGTGITGAVQFTIASS